MFVAFCPERYVLAYFGEDVVDAMLEFTRWVERAVAGAWHFIAIRIVIQLAPDMTVSEVVYSAETQLCIVATFELNFYAQDVVFDAGIETPQRGDIPFGIMFSAESVIGDFLNRLVKGAPEQGQPPISCGDMMIFSAAGSKARISRPGSPPSPGTVAK